MFEDIPRMFSYIPRNVWGHSPECLVTFLEMFSDIPRNVWRYSPECLRTFPRMFDDIPWNVWGHSPECLAIFPGMFSNIPLNVWWHSPEYNIPHITRVPRILFAVPVFLVLHIAALKSKQYFYKENNKSEIKNCVDING